MVERVFQDLFDGEIREGEAVTKLHKMCNQIGVNPAVESPITMLMVTKCGQKRLKLYEEFIMQANWLVAKVSAREIPIARAVDTFVIELEKITKLMLKGNG